MCLGQLAALSCCWPLHAVVIGAVVWSNKPSNDVTWARDAWVALWIKPNAELRSMPRCVPQRIAVFNPSPNVDARAAPPCAFQEIDGNSDLLSLHAGSWTDEKTNKW